MSTASRVLAVARAELGTREHPPGSNRVKYSDWYGLVGAWCAMFVSWVADQADAADLIPRHAWTPSGAAWFRGRGQWGTQPRPGALVFFEWPGMGRISHVGFVEAVHADGSITTIEGNTDVAGGRTGGQVMRQRRSQYIAGYGYPAYALEDAAAPVRPLPEHTPSPAPAPAPTTRRLKVDVIDLSRVRRGRPATYVRNMKRQVKALQRLLGFTGKDVDGIGGPNTAEELERRQRAARVTGDRQFGPVTAEAFLAGRGIS